MKSLLVLNCLLDKRSNLKMASLWALGNCDQQFTHYLEIMWTKQLMD